MVIVYKEKNELENAEFCLLMAKIRGSKSSIGRWKRRIKEIKEKRKSIK